MAKSSKILNDFSGGLNQRSDPKDIDDNEYAESINVSNMISGKLRNVGTLKGVDFEPAEAGEEFISFQLGATTAQAQGYGMTSLNLDSPVQNNLVVTFTDAFGSASWVDVDGTGGTSSHGSGAYTLASGTSATNFSAINIDKSSLSITDGTKFQCFLSVTNEANHTPTERTNLYIALGCADADMVAANVVYSSDGSVLGTPQAGCNWEDFAGVGKVISFVGEWGSEGDFIEIRLEKRAGSGATSLTIDDFYMYELPDTPSNNVFVTNGDGKVDLVSNIGTEDYTGDEEMATETSTTGTTGLSDIKVDMSYTNSVLRISNGKEIHQWSHQDRVRKVISTAGSSYNYFLRNIEKTNYATAGAQTGGYEISSNYKMSFPQFGSANVALAHANTTATRDDTWINPVFDEATINYDSDTIVGVKLDFKDVESSGVEILADMKEVWYFGASLLLDDDQQETKITWETATVDLTDDSWMPKIKLLTGYYPSWGKAMWDPRVTGYRIWMSPTPGGGDPLLLVEADLVDMTYSIYGTSHLNNPFENAGYRPDYLRPNDTGYIQLDTKPAIQFSELKGYAVTEEIYAGYKTSKVVGSVRYIGDIIQGGVHYEDRVIRSQEFEFDIFPENNFIDVIANDGDKIVALEGYGEELLVFKRSRVYVISAKPGEESLEGEWPGIGIYQPSQVCETEQGIVWINASGLYLYDGDVKNLAEDKMPESNLAISASRALNLVDESAGISIGYSPEDKKAFYTFGPSNQSFMLYDFKSETFQPCSGTYGTGNAETCTNFVNANAVHTNRNYLIYGSKTTAVSSNDMEIYHWSDNPATTEVTEGIYYWVSKDMDFGNPTLRKKVYGVYITYRVTGTGQAEVMPMFAINSARYATAAAFITAAKSSDAGLFSHTTSFFAGTTDVAIGQSGDYHFLIETNSLWKTAYLKPAVSANLNNIYSFQFALANKGAVYSDFEVNDITVIYREKSQK